MDITINPASNSGLTKESFTDPNTAIHVKVYSPGGGGTVEKFNSKTAITLTNLNSEDMVSVKITGTLDSNETININSTGDEWLTVEDITQKVGTVATSFRDNKRLTRANVGNSDMSNVTNMSYAFYNCSSLTNITLPDSLSNVTDMSYIFYDCTNLTSITLPNSLSNVTNMSSVFDSCASLTNVTLPNDLSKVENFSTVFYYCRSLLTVNPTNIDFPSVRILDSCLRHLDVFNQDLSGWRFPENVPRKYMWDNNTPNWLPEHKPQFVL